MPAPQNVCQSLPQASERRAEIPLNDWLQRQSQNVVKVPLRYAVNSGSAHPAREAARQRGSAAAGVDLKKAQRRGQ